MCEKQDEWWKDPGRVRCPKCKTVDKAETKQLPVCSGYSVECDYCGHRYHVELKTEFWSPTAYDPEKSCFF